MTSAEIPLSPFMKQFCAEKNPAQKRPISNAPMVLGAGSMGSSQPSSTETEPRLKAIVTLEDTTERHLLENEMRSHRENELVWQLVAEHSNRLIYRYDIAANIAYADLAVGPDAAKIDFNVSEAAIEDGRILPESVADYRRLFL